MSKKVPPSTPPVAEHDPHLKWAEVLQRDPELWQDFKDFLKGLDKGLEKDYDAADKLEEFLRIQASRRFLQEVEFRATASEREETAYAGRQG